MGRNAQHRRQRRPHVVVWHENEDRQIIASLGRLQLLVAWAPADEHYHVEVFEHGPQRGWRSDAATQPEAMELAVTVAEGWPPPPSDMRRFGFAD